MPYVGRERTHLPDDVDADIWDPFPPNSDLTSSDAVAMSPAAMDMSRRQSVQRRISTWRRTLSLGGQNNHVVPNGTGMFAIRDPPLLQLINLLQTMLHSKTKHSSRALNGTPHPRSNCLTGVDSHLLFHT